jgi:LysR family transcriptional activator of nhaA
MQVSQSAVSAQIRQLEDQLGVELFDRSGRSLHLTEAGRVALAYADDIFRSADDLRSTLRRGRSRTQVLRVGAVATLSRNFQQSFLMPLFEDPDLRLRIESGGLVELVDRLTRHSLDVVLSNRPPRSADETLRCRRIARQGVSVVGPDARQLRFPDDLEGAALLVPGPESDIRSEFDALCAQIGLRVRVLAEVDDMATMRLLARDTEIMALVPSVVVRDELRSGALHEYCVVPGLFESFYATTIERSYEHPVLRTLLVRDETELLATVA